MEWLNDTPIRDPVSRRNAPFMQVLLICMGLLNPANKTIHFFSASFRASMTGPGLVADMTTNLIMAMAAWISLYLIRQGRFRKAVGFYLTVMLAAGWMGYAVIGLNRLSNDPLPLLLLGLAGLMLGRRSLWRVYAMLMLMFAVGTLSDAVRESAVGMFELHWRVKASMAISYLVVAVVLDRTITALRESLKESNARGRALKRTNRRLEHEMIERERTMEQLIHAQKMEAVGRVASGVAHDFDNILGVILGYTARRERLADGGIAPLLDAMHGIQTAAERAAMISRQLLGFSRHDQRKLELLDLLDLMHQVLPMLRQLFVTQTRVTVSLPEQPAWVEIDRGQVELILLSVAANANDAMPDGGRFSITMRVLSDHVAIEFSDSGNGIAAGDTARIFEPFYTTKPLGSGTGLGLSVARDVLTRAGGDISVRSRRGGGASFLVRLPLAAASALGGQCVASPAIR